MRHRLLAALGCLVAALTAGCGGNDSNTPASGSGPVTPPATNAVPNARAGGAQSVLVGTSVQLDGTASTDPSF